MEKLEDLLASLDPEYYQKAQGLRVPMTSDMTPMGNPDVPIKVPPPIAKPKRALPPTGAPTVEPVQPMKTDHLLTEEEAGLPPRPDVNEYIKKKFDLGEYSDENRKKIEDENAKYDFGGRLSAAAAALGAGLMGGNAAGAGQGMLSRLDAEKKGKLDAFDKGRANHVEKFNLDEAANKVGLEDEKFQRENDPNSEETVLARTLAGKMAPGVDFSKMTARQINEKIPSLQKIYEIELRRQEVQSQAADRKMALGLKANEGQKALDKDYAKDYNDFTGGGNTKALDAIQKLKDWRAKLASEDKEWFGAGGGPIAGSLPDMLRDEESIAMRDNIVSVANSALKATFGGQGLTDSERRALANEFYNDKLSPKANLEIMDRKISELESARSAQEYKAKYFQKGSTLEGFDPSAGLETKEPTAPIQDPGFLAWKKSKGLQ